MQINDGAYIVEEELEIHPAALIMPPMEDEEFSKFKEDILGNGLIEPLVLFQGKILDGRNRYRACRELEIDVWARKWEGGMDPVEYVASKNIHRRHLTKGQLADCAAKAIDYHVQEAKERQKAAGGDKKSEEYKKSVVVPVQQPILEDEEYKQAANSDVIIDVEPKIIAPAQQAIPESSYEKKAVSRAGKLFGVSGKTVARAKYIHEHGTEEEKKALETGKAAVKHLERQVRERVQNTPKAKPTFNQTTDSIEWAKWTWNPVTGCKHGCKYCYARDIAYRYPDGFPKGFEPNFIPSRLEAPANTKLPEKKNEGNRNVFVCSMADLFGDWVPEEWIDAVLCSCAKSPEWNFIFLTKNPKRLVGIGWPDNAWVGTTVDCQSRVEAAVSAFRAMREGEKCPSVTFVSCEPLNEPLSFDGGLSFFDWVIIGGRSQSNGMPAFQPEWEWVESLHYEARMAGCKVYWKPNLTVRPREYPQ
jgi:protein gp37